MSLHRGAGSGSRDERRSDVVHVVVDCVLRLKIISQSKIEDQSGELHAKRIT